MSKIWKYLLFSIITFLFISCKKEFFNWNLISAPTISEITIEENNLKTVSVSASCEASGNDTKIVNGFCWSQNEIPTINDSVINCSDGQGYFQTKINWSNSKTIYVRAFSQNGIAIKYSESKKITWSGDVNLQPTLSINRPIITGFNSIDISGSIHNLNGLEINETGFCVSSNSSPTILNALKVVKVNANSSNDYKASISDLTNGYSFYVTFYTKSIAGYTYSKALYFNLPRKYEIGEIGPGNGIVFYQRPDFSNDWNFLEVFYEYVGGVCAWSPNSNKTSVTDQSLGSGYENTTNIISIVGPNSSEYAAHKSKITSNNKTDWYLPSILELQLGLEQLKKINVSALNKDGVYWSSSEDKNFSTNVWVVKYSNNDFKLNTVDKSNLNAVQPIRRF